MNLKDVKNLSFPKSDYEQWQSALEAGLKGKAIDKLQTVTYEGITLEPLYTNENASVYAETEMPGKFPYTRGIFTNGYHEQPWLISQPIDGADSREANAQLKTALLRGQNAIVFPASLFAQGGELGTLLAGLPLNLLPLYIDAKGLQILLLSQLEKLSSPLTGVLAEDPIAEWCLDGEIPEKPSVFFESWFNTLRAINEHSPHLKSILIKSVTFHNAGASAIQELAYALATAILYLEEGQKNGFTVEELAEKMVFSFAVDSNYFMNIAKLRAARRLWAQLAEAYDADPKYFRMIIHAVTSERTETLYDEHVNILRTANQAFAAAIGGIQYLEIHPFNHASGKEDDRLANRIARNIHLLLKEETHITTVADPAGGSWYVEQLTDELAAKAWDKFFDIHTSGGMIPLIREGKIQEEIASISNKRKNDVASRKVSIIGTNVYPNPADSGSVRATTKDKRSYYRLNQPTLIRELTLNRLAEPFEEIRQRSTVHKKTSGEAPKIGLINLGERKSYKPRAEFVEGLAASGGIEVVQSEGCQSSQDATEFIKKSLVNTFCLCGSDADYQDSAVQIAAEIKRDFPEIQLYLAGKQSEEVESMLRSAGIKAFITIKTDAVKLLNELQKQLGVLG